MERRPWTKSILRSFWKRTSSVCFDEAAQKEIADDCEGFVEEASDMIAGEETPAGHDFCLTRNGHGAGFWDGGWDETEASVLTKMSKAYGSQTAVVDLDENGDVINLSVTG